MIDSYGAQTCCALNLQEFRCGGDVDGDRVTATITVTG